MRHVDRKKAHQHFFLFNFFSGSMNSLWQLILINHQLKKKRIVWVCRHACEDGFWGISKYFQDMLNKFIKYWKEEMSKRWKEVQQPCMQTQHSEWEQRNDQFVLKKWKRRIFYRWRLFNCDKTHILRFHLWN